MLDKAKRTVPFYRDDRGGSYEWHRGICPRVFNVQLSNAVKITVGDPTVDGRDQYTKREALYFVKQTVKGSEERGALIQFMVENELVPNRTALYRLIKTNEDGIAIGSNEWGAKGKPSHEDHVKTNSLQKPVPKRERIDNYDNVDKWKKQGYPRRRLLDYMGWRGSIFLRVREAHFSWTSAEERVDICQHIGTLKEGDNINRVSNYNEWDRRVCKLYFCKVEFPPPNGEMDGHGGFIGRRNNAFAKLKHYINMESRKTGSAVICCGGDNREKYRHKRFACKHKYWENGKEKRCPFSFQVRWDMHGYYIHLLNSPENWRPFGCSWHLCNRKSFV